MPQSLPVNPPGHVHENVAIPFLHIPSFLQGFESQLSISTKNNK